MKAMRTARLGRDETFAHGQRSQPVECEQADVLDKFDEIKLGVKCVVNEEDAQFPRYEQG